jgi:2-C-methyl-D-erythritol 2,4-cyclodiphosphate synthase
MSFRIGQGFDVHAFGPGDHVTLGGVRIAHPQGIVAHSDGDVLLHAVIDALLGAAGLGDIGRRFPDGDAKYRGADSRELLRTAWREVAALGFRVVNLDCTVICQAPRLAPHVASMRAHLASDLGVSAGEVNVKATTSERLGFTGRGEGIAASAVVLLAHGA